MQSDAATQAYEAALLALAAQTHVTLQVSERAMTGNRHQRVVRDAARNESPMEAWQVMQTQGAMPGTTLEFKVAHSAMEYCTKLYWKYTPK